MQVLFCGSGEFAAPSLAAVAAAGHEVVGVITQPARPAGRGGKLRVTPIAEKAGQMGLELREAEDVNDEASVEWIASRRPDVICVVDFGQMVRAAVRDQARIDTFNLHGSLLPELRGAAPVNWALIRGYRTTGVTTFSLVDRMDAGPIYLQAELEVAPDEQAEALRRRCAELGAELVCRTLELLTRGKAEAAAQDESRATYAPQLTKSDGLIDWTADAATIVNLVRGTWPWPAAQAVFRRWDGAEIGVKIACASARDGEGQDGRVDQDLCVGAGRGRIGIEQIKPAGGRLMSWRDFINGYRVQPGDQFLQVRS